ncbi:hypothetical protein BDF14DRAFT_1745007 [Spinellus fusiger]|nr:hypothetical protein BDF14DRAFT_1745007 [Spinellus fusiger]
MSLDFLSGDFVFPSEPIPSKLLSNPDIKVPETVNWGYQATKDSFVEYKRIATGRLSGIFTIDIRNDTEDYSSETESNPSSPYPLTPMDFSSANDVSAIPYHLSYPFPNINSNEEDVQVVTMNYHEKDTFYQQPPNYNSLAWKNATLNSQSDIVYDSDTEIDSDSVYEIQTASPATTPSLKTAVSQDLTLVSCGTGSIYSSDKTIMPETASAYSSRDPSISVSLRSSKPGFNLATSSFQDLFGKFKKHKSQGSLLKTATLNSSTPSPSPPTKRLQRFLGLVNV